MPQHQPPGDLSPASARDSRASEAQDDDVALQPGSSSWSQPLTRKAKWQRLAVIVGVALLAASVIGGSSVVSRLFPPAGGRATANAPSSLRSGLPFPTFPTTNLRASLPTSAYTTPISNIDIAPGYSADAQVSSAWVCWVTEPLLRSPDSASVLHAARTADGGQTWGEFTPPLASARGCRIVVDHSAPARALLIADAESGMNGACATYLALTDDGGGHWSAIPPAPGYAGLCAANYVMLADTIFVSAPTDTATRQPRPVELWRINGGASWIPTGTGRPDLTLAAVAGMRASGRLVGAALGADSNAGVGRLVESGDRGATWSEIGDLPGPNAALIIDERPADLRARTDPIYAISDRSPQTARDTPARALWRWNDARHLWAALPGIPHLSNAPDPLALPESSVIGAGPDGGLLVSAASASSMSEEQPQQDFWYWNDTAQRWIVNQAVSAAGVYLYGLGWSNEAATLWLIYLHIGVPPHLELYTTRFSADAFMSS